jgi:hypothetical protein
MFSTGKARQNETPAAAARNKNFTQMPQIARR